MSKKGRAQALAEGEPKEYAGLTKAAVFLLSIAVAFIDADLAKFSWLLMLLGMRPVY